MSPDFRRGIAAIEKASEPKQGGTFSAFAPTIAWREDKEEKYVLFLNPAESIPTVKMHEWIEVGTRQNGKPIYEWFISRKDAAIGESYDDIEDRLGQPARERTIAVAVELEPTFEQIKGRKRPTGFEIKTDTFERKTDDGTEEVVMPVIGLVIQSPLNFFGWIGSFNENTAPIEETPLRVERQGKDANTQYNFTAYLDQSVDYTNLFEYLDGISYLKEESDDLRIQAQKLDAPEAALSVGAAMLEKRLDELADSDRYEQLVAQVEELPDRFGKRKATQSSPKRAERSTQRETAGLGNRDKFARLRAEVEAQQ